MGGVRLVGLFAVGGLLQDKLIKLKDKMATYTIQGAKKKPKKPTLTKDTVSSTSTVAILYGLAEGEIKGLVNGGASIRLDDTPLIGENGQKNYPNVHFDFKAGTKDQSHMAGFNEVSGETPVGVVVKKNLPFVKAITNTALDAVEIRLQWARLVRQTTEGDVHGTRVDYAFDLQTDGGGFVEVLKTHIAEKTSQGYERTHRINLPKAAKGWTIRVRRLTNDSDSDLVSDEMAVDAIAQVIDAKLCYPHTALLGLKYSAEQFSSIAKIAVECDGRIIQVPVNYDPIKRTTAGIWDGTFKLAYTNNPAWVFYDLCTHERFGLGQKITASMVDKWRLYELAKYCDEMVDDGKGGLEPRFTCNVYLQSTEDAYNVLKNITGIFRGLLFWDGEKVALDMDAPKDPAYTFSRANVVNGEFSYTGTRARDRHTAVKVAWDNPQNGYKTEYLFVTDETALAKYGINTLDLSAFGCTSEGQAQRLGQWALKTEQLETRQVSFSVGLDGFLPKIGQVINVSDELFAGRANGGRVVAIDGKNITLDRTAEMGDLLLNGDNGKTVSVKITAVDGNTATVAEQIDGVSVGNVWAINTPNLKLMQFRVLSISQKDSGQFDITAIQFEPQKFAYIDEHTDIKPDPITAHIAYNLKSPQSVAISSLDKVNQGIRQTTLIIEWAKVAGASRYRVAYRAFVNGAGGDWQSMPDTENLRVEIDAIRAGIYEARVWAIGAFDAVSLPTTSEPTAINARLLPPKPPAKLTVKGVLFGFELAWQFAKNSEDGGFTQIQISENGGTNIAPLGDFAYPTTTAQISGLQGDLIRQFRARLVDKMGNTSEWTDWQTGKTDSSPQKVLSLISGHINQSDLAQSLGQKIGEIDAIKTQANNTIQEIGILKTQDATQKQSIDNLTAKQNTLSADIQAINTTIASDKQSLTQQINNQTAKIGDLLAQINTIKQTQVDDKMAATTELNDAKSQLKNAVAELNNLKQTQAQQNQSLAQQTTALQASIDKVDGTLQAAFDPNKIEGKNYILDTPILKMGGLMGANRLIESTDLNVDEEFAEFINRKNGDTCYFAFSVFVEKNSSKSLFEFVDIALNRIGGEVEIRFTDGTVKYYGAWRWNQDEGFQGKISTIGVIASKRIKQVLARIQVHTIKGDVLTVHSPKLELLTANDWGLITPYTPSPKAGMATAKALSDLKSEVQTVDGKTVAIASQTQTLQSSINGVRTSVETQARTIDGIKGEYTVKVDSGGRVAGFGLMNDGRTSEFAIKADKFYIAGEYGKGSSPFMFLSTPQNINGTVIPAGAYLNSAYILDGSIDNAKIKNAAIDTAKIANGAITTAKIGTAQVDTLQIKGDAVVVPRAQSFNDRRENLQGEIFNLSLEPQGGSVVIDATFFVDAWNTAQGRGNVTVIINFSLELTILCNDVEVAKKRFWFYQTQSNSFYRSQGRDGGFITESFGSVSTTIGDKAVMIKNFVHTNPPQNATYKVLLKKIDHQGTFAVSSGSVLLLCVKR